MDPASPSPDCWRLRDSHGRAFSSGFQLHVVCRVPASLLLGLNCDEREHSGSMADHSHLISRERRFYTSQLAHSTHTLLGFSRILANGTTHTNDRRTPQRCVPSNLSVRNSRILVSSFSPCMELHAPACLVSISTSLLHHLSSWRTSVTLATRPGPWSASN